MESQKTLRVQKARAIVIKEKCTGESNKQLTVLAKDLGKLTFFAKGAKGQNSKFFAGAQPFCYSDFVLYNGGDFLSVTQIDLIRNFSTFYFDIYKLMYGSLFLELIDKTVMYSQESNDIMRLLLEGLQKLEKTDCPKKISAAFQIKLFDLLGICPEADVCSACGKRNPADGLFYKAASFANYGGFTCAGCCEGAAREASAGTLRAISFIKEAAGEAFSFDAAESIIDELYHIAEIITSSQLETQLNTPGIIKNL